VDRALNRKAFVTTLGAAGLGFGLALGGSAVHAQESDETSSPTDSDMRARWDDMDAELYAAFTAALGEELGVADTEVDDGIRAALATVVDGFASDDLVTPGQATAVKALIETLDAPVGPGPLLAHPHGMVTHAFGPEGGPALPDAAVSAVQVDAPSNGPAAIAQRFYPDFTAALATELGAGSADEVDGSIRMAMMAVIDGLDTDALPMPIPTDALKAMIATAESPLGPGLLFGPPPGMMIGAFHGRHGEEHDFPGRGRGGDDDWFGEDRPDQSDDADEAESETDKADDDEDEASA
jgi:hypothetical protein